jgi:thioesterase domain-containing protein
MLGVGRSSTTTSLPVTALQNELVGIWKELLGSVQIGTGDNFFDVGGDSLLAVMMFAEVHARLGVSLPASTLFSGATVEHLVQIIAQADAETTTSALVPIQPGGTRSPLFCVHALDGDVVIFGALARHLGEDQPLYGLRVPTVDGEMRLAKYEDLAAAYVEAIRTVQPHGPYLLAGFSYGAGLALEMARRFTGMGEKVAFVASFDGTPPHSGYKKLHWKPGYFAKVLERSVASGNGLRRLTSAQRAAYAHQEALMLRNMVMNSVKRRLVSRIPGWSAPPLNTDDDASDLRDIKFAPREREIAVGLTHLAGGYTPQTYSGRITVFRAEVQPLITTGDLQLEWGAFAEGGVDVIRVPGTHDTLLSEPHVRTLAGRLRACLRAVG